MRIRRYTPALTMVAAWISAETGVGASIANGSQTWRGICADLPIGPMNNSNAITERMGACHSRPSHPRRFTVWSAYCGAADKIA
jgi:hypothetical protein